MILSRFMSQQRLIDGFEFASAGAMQHGAWPLRDFPRLRDILAFDSGEVSYTLNGVRDARGRPGLRVRVRGALQLRCQRCLEPMTLEVQSVEVLLLAATVAEIHEEAADAQAPDRVVAGKDMPVRDLIEDELILAVPYAPRHERCAPAPALEADEKTDSPFAALRGLMRGGH